MTSATLALGTYAMQSEFLQMPVPSTLTYEATPMILERPRIIELQSSHFVPANSFQNQDMAPYMRQQSAHTLPANESNSSQILKGRVF